MLTDQKIVILSKTEQEKDRHFYSVRNVVADGIEIYFLLAFPLWLERLSVHNFVFWPFSMQIEHFFPSHLATLDFLIPFACIIAYTPKVYPFFPNATHEQCVHMH